MTGHQAVDSIFDSMSLFWMSKSTANPFCSLQIHCLFLTDHCLYEIIAKYVWYLETFLKLKEKTGNRLEKNLHRGKI